MEKKRKTIYAHYNENHVMIAIQVVAAAIIAMPQHNERNKYLCCGVNSMYITLAWYIPKCEKWIGEIFSLFVIQFTGMLAIFRKQLAGM